MIQSFFRFIALVISLLSLTACHSQSTNPQPTGERISITTTTGMIADLVRNVGGAYVEVTELMGPGIDPHLYKASQGDIRKLEQADAIFITAYTSKEK